MSVEPKARFSSILLKAKKKENKPPCCNFSHGSASEYGFFLRYAQVMFSWPAQGCSVLLQSGLVWLSPNVPRSL